MTGLYERGRAVGTTRWKNSFGCSTASSSHRAGRIALLQDVFHAPLDRGLDLRMGENVEALVAHRLVHLLRHVRGGEFPGLHRFFQARIEREVGGALVPGFFQSSRAVAPGIRDAGG